MSPPWEATHLSCRHLVVVPGLARPGRRPALALQRALPHVIAWTLAHLAEASLRVTSAAGRHAVRVVHRGELAAAAAPRAASRIDFGHRLAIGILMPTASRAVHRVHQQPRPAALWTLLKPRIAHLTSPR